MIHGAYSPVARVYSRKLFGMYIHIGNKLSKYFHSQWWLPCTIPASFGDFQFMVINDCYFFFREMTVFNQGDPIYHSKVLSFYRKENFDLEAVYANPTPFIHVPQIGKDIR